MRVAVAVRSDRQADLLVELGVDVAVRVEAHAKRRVDGEEPPKIPIGGCGEVAALLDRLDRSGERLGLRSRVRSEILEVKLDAPWVLVRGDEPDRLREKQRVRAILE